MDLNPYPDPPVAEWPVDVDPDDLRVLRLLLWQRARAKGAEASPWLALPDGALLSYAVSSSIRRLESELGDRDPEQFSR